MDCIVLGRAIVPHGDFGADSDVSASPTTPWEPLRGIALGRKAWLFAGSARGGDRGAFIYTLIESACLNDIDPQVWLADVLARIKEDKAHDPDQLLPWNWITTASVSLAA